MGSTLRNLEMFRYLDHPVGGGRVVAAACGTAADIASIKAVLTPNRYTSNARVLIQPPGGNDPRGAMARSPIYLKSIKRYELVAWEDSLFLDTIDHFKLRKTGSADRLKRSVCKATIPRNTKALEIAATLHEPTPTRELTLYIAEQTVRSASDATAEVLERPAASHAVAQRPRKTRND